MSTFSSSNSSSNISSNKVVTRSANTNVFITSADTNIPSIAKHVQIQNLEPNISKTTTTPILIVRNTSNAKILRTVQETPPSTTSKSNAHQLTSKGSVPRTLFGIPMGRKQVASSEASQEQPQQIIMASNDDIEKGKTDHLKSMKSASINALFKKSRKMNKISTTEKTKPLVASPNLNPENMFDYNKSEAATLGFEPLGAQMSKPEISVVNLSDYTQVTSKAASASIPSITTSSTTTFMTAALPSSSSNNTLKGPPLASEEEISIQTATPTDDVTDDMNIAAESEVIKTSSLSSKRVVTFSMPSTIEASQNSLSQSTPDLRTLEPLQSTQIGYDSASIPQRKPQLTSRGTSTQNDYPCCGCNIEDQNKEVKLVKRSRCQSSDDEHRLLKRASKLLSSYTREAETITTQQKLDKVSKGDSSSTTTSRGLGDCFANPSMASLIVQRRALTRRLITTLVALNEVNQELEQIFLQREKYLLDYGGGGAAAGVSLSLEDANQRHQRVPWQQREQWVGTTFEEVRNFAADGTTSRIAAEDDEDHFHYKGLSQRPIKALSYPYLCEHNNTSNVVQMNTRNYYDFNEDTNQNNPQESGFWVQDQNNDNQHKIAAGGRRSPYFCGNSVTETEVGQQQQLQPPHKEEALFQAASSTTSFKTNFVGIESWANFVTAKETPLME